jgi:hypothetical protein
MNAQKKCKDKVEGAFNSRMEDIRHLVEADSGRAYYCNACEEYDEDFTDDEASNGLKCFYCESEDILDIRAEIGDLSEYGLCIDLVEAGTFKDQREDYVRYQLSWGGPSEEFRIYRNDEIEFWYLDWFDGACVPVTGNDADIIKAVIEPMFPDFIRS